MLPDGTINPGQMTSFNHYALGAVVDWLHRTVAGLAPLEPGYARVLVAPQPGGGLTWARTSLETRHGAVAVAWTQADGGRAGAGRHPARRGHRLVRLPGERRPRDRTRAPTTSTTRDAARRSPDRLPCRRGWSPRHAARRRRAARAWPPSDRVGAEPLSESRPRWVLTPGRPWVNVRALKRSRQRGRDASRGLCAVCLPIRRSHEVQQDGPARSRHGGLHVVHRPGGGRLQRRQPGQQQRRGQQRGQRRRRHDHLPDPQRRRHGGADQGAHRRLPGGQPGHHGQHRHPPRRHRRRQHHQDPAGHRRHGRRLRVQQRLAAAGDQARAEPDPAGRPAVGRPARRQLRGVLQGHRRQAVRRARSARPSAAACSTTSRSTRSSA